MVSCTYCHRKFGTEEQLNQHLISCRQYFLDQNQNSRPRVTTFQGRGPAWEAARLNQQKSQSRSPRSPRSPLSASTKKAKTMKSLVLVCYLCGGSFGFSSLHIHMKTCLKAKQLAAGDFDEVPSPPVQDPPDFNASAKVIAAYNREAMAIARGAMYTCEICHRKFRTWADCEKHMGSCS